MLLVAAAELQDSADERVANTIFCVMMAHEWCLGATEAGGSKT